MLSAGYPFQHIPRRKESRSDGAFLLIYLPLWHLVGMNKSCRYHFPESSSGKLLATKSSPRGLGTD